MFCERSMVEKVNGKVEECRKLFLAVLGTLFFAGGMNLFIVSANLYSGGFLGIGQLVRTLLVDLLGLPIKGIDIAGIVFYMINVPIFFIAWKELGKKFFVITIICVTMQTIFLTFIPTEIQILGDEPLASALIGGVICGYGVGLTLREGGSGGGQDVLGLYMMKKKNSFSVGKLALMINVAVYLGCALLYDLKIVIYSLVYVAVSSYVTDRVHLQNVNVEVMVITKAKKEIEEIIRKYNRSATVMKGEGSYSHEGVNVIYSALSKHEARSLEHEISEKNLEGFMVFKDVNHIYGKYDKHL